MPAFADRTKRPPRTPTDSEVKRLLAVTGKAKDGFRDHMILSLTLGCGLRESEIVALNIGDVTKDPKRRKPVRVIELRVFKRAGLDARPEDHRVHVPDATYYKLEKYLKTGLTRDGFAPSQMYPDTQLFWSKKGNRLSTKAVRTMCRTWQKRAGFDHFYNFHSLRHYAITAVRRRTKDIRIAQRFARHVNIATTIRYEHASDEELAAAVKGMVA